MRLKEYIEHLQGVLDKHGNLMCYYATDDECNSYHSVNYCCSVGYTERLDHTLEYVRQPEDVDEVLIPICVIN